MAATIRLQREPFDAASEAAKLRRGRRDIGAVVTFTGICRSDEGGVPLAAMTLEHYPGMAEAEVARHVEAAGRRGPPPRGPRLHPSGRPPARADTPPPGPPPPPRPGACFASQSL